MKRVVCEHCGKLLREAPEDENRGTTASKIQHAGYISKMPILWGVTDGFHFFCSKDVGKLGLKLTVRIIPKVMKFCVSYGKMSPRL